MSAWWRVFSPSKGYPAADERRSFLGARDIYFDRFDPQRQDAPIRQLTDYLEFSNDLFCTLARA
jgi:hypothetical protein